MRSESSKYTAHTNSFKPENAPPIRIGRIALITRDWYDEADWFEGDRWGFGFMDRLRDAVEATRDEAPEGLVFGLWTWNEDEDGAVPRRLLFPEGTHHEWALLETCRNNTDVAELHFREIVDPAIMYQRFATSQDAVERKQRFIDELETRTFGGAVILLCGESNIIKTRRGSYELDDRFGFLSFLQKNDIELVLNPIHTYMQRYEMPLKRKAFSRSGRTVLTVWNRGESKQGEAHLPWAAYHDGEDSTDRLVREVESGRIPRGARVAIYEPG